jgi:hypothetical protein
MVLRQDSAFMNVFLEFGQGEEFSRVVGCIVPVMYVSSDWRML